MDLDKARKMSFTATDKALKVVAEAVRCHRPKLTVGQFNYVTNEVFMLLCRDTDPSLLEQPTEKWTPNLLDTYFKDKVEDYLVRLEIKTGRIILYGEE